MNPTSHSSYPLHPSHPSHPSQPSHLTPLAPLPLPAHPSRYMQEFRTSKFCLCPPGWATWTPRVFESLLLGCIPAVVADHNVLPFQRSLDYQSFAVFIPEKRKEDIKQILKDVAPERLERMQIMADEVAEAFLYNTPPQPGDAFYHIAHELYWRVQTLGVRTRDEGKKTKSQAKAKAKAQAQAKKNKAKGFANVKGFNKRRRKGAKP